jgi:hypothetical protein
MDSSSLLMKKGEAAGDSTCVGLRCLAQSNSNLGPAMQFERRIIFRIILKG